MDTFRKLGDVVLQIAGEIEKRTVAEIQIEHVCGAMVQRAQVLATHARTGQYLPGGRTFRSSLLTTTIMGGAD